jgi:WD40 repeat protein
MSLSALIAVAALTQAPAPVSLKLVKVVQGVRPFAMAPAPTGSRILVTLENREIRYMDAGTRLTLKSFKGHPQDPYAIALNPKGTVLASGDESGRIFYWDVASAKKVKEVRTHTRGVQNLSFDSTGTTILSTGKDDTLRYYDSKSGKELKVIYGKGANFYGARFVPGTKSAVVGTLSSGTRLYAPTYQLGRSFTGHSDNAVWDVDVKGGRVVSAGRDATAIVWDYKTGKKIQTLRGHGDWVVRALFSPNGRLLATSSSDSTVIVWDMKSMKQVAKFEQQSMVGSPLCWTADGKYLITAGADDFMQIYSVNPPMPAGK